MRRLLVLLLAVVLLAGCGDDGDAYCDTVADRQEELSEIVGGGSPDALIQALDDAGVDPATYDPDSPPAGLGEAEQQEIAAAASRLGSAETAQALQALDQQARDVCKTPLTL